MKFMVNNILPFLDRLAEDHENGNCFLVQVKKEKDLKNCIGLEYLAELLN